MENERNCSLFSDRKFVIVAGVNMASALVSLLACFVAIFIIILFKKWQTFGQRLILYLIISTTLQSIDAASRIRYSGEEFSIPGKGFCIFTGFLGQVSAWMVINTCMSITVYLMLGVTCNKFTEKYEVAYVLLIFALPPAVNWIPFIQESYGRAGVWCWIRSIDLSTCHRIVFGQVLQLALYYVPLFAVLSILLLLYLIILCKLRGNNKRWKGVPNDTDGHKNNLLKSETLYLLVYPLILFVLNIPLVINRIVGWAHRSDPVLALWYISGVTFPLYGAVTVLAFMLESDTRQRLRWSHIRAAFKNYNSKKGISEYEIEVTEEAESTKEAGHYKHVPYKQITDNTVVDKVN